MNTVSFTPLPDTDQIKVTIHSEGERDQSALMSHADFLQDTAEALNPSPAGDVPAEEAS